MDWLKRLFAIIINWFAPSAKPQRSAPASTPRNVVIEDSDVEPVVNVAPVMVADEPEPPREPVKEPASVATEPAAAQHIPVKEAVAETQPENPNRYTPLNPLPTLARYQKPEPGIMHSIRKPVAAMTLLASSFMPAQSQNRPKVTQTPSQPGITQQAQDTEVLRFGMYNNPKVEELQKKLNRAKFDCGKPDGDFGTRTKRAVIRLQKWAKITPDGEYGKDSKIALDKRLAEIEALAQNSNPLPEKNSEIKTQPKIKRENPALPKTPAEVPFSPQNIVLVAGHSDKDPGALGEDGTKERELTIEYAKRFKTMAEEAGHKVTILSENSSLYGKDDHGKTTKDRAFTDVARRAADQNPDVILYLHFDASAKSSSRGARVMAAENSNKDSLRLVDHAAQQLSKGMKFPPHGFAGISISSAIANRLKKPTRIALVEGGFLTNPHELAELKTLDHQQQFCSKLLKAVESSHPQQTQLASNARQGTVR